MRDVAIRLVAFGPEHLVREVVILVKHQIEREPHALCGFDDRAEFRLGGEPLQRCGEFSPVMLLVEHCETVEANTEILFEALLQRGVRGGNDAGEIQVEHLVAVLVLRRVLRDFEAAEERVEMVLLGDVVVAAQHAGHERLPEAARAYEKQKRPRLLQKRNVACLVDVVVAFVADSLEVRDAVGDFEVVFHGRFPFAAPILAKRRQDCKKAESLGAAARCPIAESSTYLLSTVSATPGPKRNGWSAPLPDRRLPSMTARPVNGTWKSKNVLRMSSISLSRTTSVCAGPHSPQ